MGSLFKIGVVGILLFLSVCFLISYPNSFTEGIYIAFIVAFALTVVDALDKVNELFKSGR